MTEEEKDSTNDSYLEELNELIESKKKENESLKTLVDAMLKNQNSKDDSRND